MALWWPKMGEQILIEPGLRIEREAHGVPRVMAADEIRLYRGLGFCHATDRGMQMLLMRVLGHTDALVGGSSIG